MLDPEQNKNEEMLQVSRNLGFK